ncbi:hypothetical protein [Dongia sedimenti]|uniref:Uncharacterized protein n=1 Tax=Dongia sedimenti TaxID=3064282 RepID=A0ABU0YKC1_9PROT|nr:hypothetical protein [Rhodospirillaceae bacterium R-7]
MAFSGWSNSLRQLVPLVMIGGALWAQSAGADGWPVAHGNPANTSYQNVLTAPAVSPIRVMSDLGTFADGISPIVSAEGNVFLGDREGNVIALRADGTRWWNHQLGSGWSVRSTPAVNSRGELFVLASRIVNDHRGTVETKRIESLLLGFADGGALLFQVPLPARGLGGISTAPLNIVRDPANAEVVVFPMRYAFSQGYYHELWLLAYNRFGVVEAEVKVGAEHGTIGSASSLDWGHDFSIASPDDPNAPEEYQSPLLGAAVPHGNGLDSSVVVVNDDMGSVARYRFSGRFAQGFTEIDRWKQGEKYPAISAPVVANNGVVLFNRPGDVLILQNDGTSVRRKVHYESDAPPAVLPNGRIIHTSQGGLEEAGGAPGPENTRSYVSPTASRNYLYASENYRLATFRIEDLALVATYDLEYGGRQQPAIGPLGHVYALTFNKLHIFPPNPSVATGTNIGPGGVAGATTAPGGSEGSSTSKPPRVGTFNPAILTQPGFTPVPGN